MGELLPGPGIAEADQQDGIEDAGQDDGHNHGLTHVGDVAAGVLHALGDGLKPSQEEGGGGQDGHHAAEHAAVGVLLEALGSGAVDGGVGDLIDGLPVAGVAPYQGGDGAHEAGAQEGADEGQHQAHQQAGNGDAVLVLLGEDVGHQIAAAHAHEQAGGGHEEAVPGGEQAGDGADGDQPVENLAGNAGIEEGEHGGGSCQAAHVQGEQQQGADGADDDGDQVHVGSGDLVEGVTGLDVGDQIAQHVGDLDGLPGDDGHESAKGSPAGDEGHGLVKGAVGECHTAAGHGEHGDQLAVAQGDGDHHDQSQDVTDACGDGAAAAGHPAVDGDGPADADDGAEANAKEVNCTDAFLFGLITHTSTSFLSCALPYGARDWKSPSNFWRAGFPRAAPLLSPKGNNCGKRIKKSDINRVLIIKTVNKNVNLRKLMAC